MFRLVNTEENELSGENRVVELICLKCLCRGVVICPSDALLKNIKCCQCGNIGYVINTGQVLEDDAIYTIR